MTLQWAAILSEGENAPDFCEGLPVTQKEGAPEAARPVLHMGKSGFII